MIFEEDNSQDITGGENSLGKSMGRSVKYGEAFKKSTKKKQVSIEESKEVNISAGRNPLEADDDEIDDVLNE